MILLFNQKLEMLIHCNKILLICKFLPNSLIKNLIIVMGEREMYFQAYLLCKNYNAAPSSLLLYFF